MKESGTCQGRRPVLPEYLDRVLAVFDGPGVAAGDRDGPSPVQVGGDDRQRRDGAQPQDGSELVGGIRDEVAIETQDVRGVIGRPKDRPSCHVGADGVQSKLERGDDAEVPPPPRSAQNRSGCSSGAVISWCGTS